MGIGISDGRWLRSQANYDTAITRDCCFWSSTRRPVSPSVKQLVEAAKADKVKGYASPGSGSPMHILGETFNKAAAVKIPQVPYRGSGPAVVDLVGGHVPMFWTTLGPVLPHITSGKLVNLAVAAPKRSPLQPNVPTLAEAGVSDVNVGAWQGLMGPKGMPADVVRTLTSI